MEALFARQCDINSEAGIDLDRVMKNVLHLARRHEVGRGWMAGWRHALGGWLRWVPPFAWLVLRWVLGGLSLAGLLHLWYRGYIRSVEGGVVSIVLLALHNRVFGILGPKPLPSGVYTASLRHATTWTQCGASQGVQQT